MIGKWLLRVGSGLAVALIETVRSTLAGETFGEFGIYAGVAGAVVGVIVSLLGPLARRVQDLIDQNR